MRLCLPYAVIPVLHAQVIFSSVVQSQISPDALSECANVYYPPPPDSDFPLPSPAQTPSRLLALALSPPWSKVVTPRYTKPVSSTQPSTRRLCSSSSRSRCPVLSLVRIQSSLAHPVALTPYPEYVVDCTVETVDYAMGRPSTSRGRSAARQNNHANFVHFVTNVLTKAEVKVPIVLVALAYMDRAKPHLQIALEQWACERVFLGALILANKVRPLRLCIGNLC